MILVPAGEFAMGSGQGKDDERPVHNVWVDSFWIDKHEVTQSCFARLTGKDPSHFKGAENPVERVPWGDAAWYCNHRSRAEGLEPCYDEETGACDFRANGYRLPTEAEWEYACRAGGASEYQFGNDEGQLADYAWHRDNSGKQDSSRGPKKAQRLGHP